jgi:hypothetical protein
MLSKYILIFSWCKANSPTWCRCYVCTWYCSRLSCSTWCSCYCTLKLLKVELFDLMQSLNKVEPFDFMHLLNCWNGSKPSCSTSCAYYTCSKSSCSTWCSYYYAAVSRVQQLHEVELFDSEQFQVIITAWSPAIRLWAFQSPAVRLDAAIIICWNCSKSSC